MFKQSKYHNKPITVDGIRFDGKMEYQRWCFLRIMEQTGEISNLRYHVNYDLIPKGAQSFIRMPDGREVVVDTYDRKRFYEADFVYVNKSGEEIVEDFKGFETESFKWKRKLFNAIYHKDIKIVKLTNAAVN